MIECTTESGRSVRLPVAAAAGSVAELAKKYPPNGQPRLHRSRYMQTPRPSIGLVRLAEREITRCRFDQRDSMVLFMCRSIQLSSMGGRNSPSGICGRPSRLPLMPTNFSTYEYHGARSA